MPSISDNLMAWNTVYQWSDGGDEWSTAWGNTDYLWAMEIYPRIMSFLPAKTILEIAPGFGRCTQYLKNYCDLLNVVDLSPKCIDACKKRFEGRRQIAYYVNNGKDLGMIKSDSVDFIFSWDSLVHADVEAIGAYLDQCPRIMKNGGYGFIHHSNLGACTREMIDEHKNPHSRDEGVSAALVNDLCRKSGLRPVVQEKIKWGSPLFNDCFTLFCKADSPVEENVFENPGFFEHAGYVRRLSSFYKTPRDKPVETPRGFSNLGHKVRRISRIFRP